MLKRVSDIIEFLGLTNVDAFGDFELELQAARPISEPAKAAVSYLKPTKDVSQVSPGPLAQMCIICSREHAEYLAKLGVTCIVANNPRLVFMRVVEHFFALAKPPAGIHASAIVSASSAVDPSAHIGANAVVGPNCKIGARTIIHANVTLVDAVTIGDDVVVNSGTVIGADGFGYERDEEFRLEKFPHIGGVIIEDNVEIGSNTSIDRGSLGNTVIKFGARIDNQCHISHNVEIGRHSAVIAQTMIGGSAVIGDYAWLAPASIVMNQVKVGPKATVGMGAVVVKDVLDGQTVMGSPAVPAAEFKANREQLKNLTKSVQLSSHK